MSEIIDSLKNIVLESVLLSFKNLDKDSILSLIMIDIPKEKSHGDYSTNIALRLSKLLKKNPIEIANIIKSNLNNNNTFKSIEVCPPGFINLFLKEENITKVISKIILEKDNYGKGENKPKKIMVEYVSANPTGDLHLGHARGAAYGDSLTRTLKFAGYNVLREFYVNDAGNQINELSKSLFYRYKELFGININKDEIGYQGKDIILLAKKIKEENGNKFLDIDEKGALEYFKNEGVKLELEKLKNDLNLFRVSFDNYQSERSLYKENKVLNTLDLIKNSPYSYYKDNALWLKTTEFNDDKDRVLIKSDGSYTYLTPDIAYHKDKFDRGYDELIDILGADHHGYISRLKGALKILNYPSENLHVLLIQMVRLMENGIEVKMSKRTGNAITIKELIEDVGVDCARYFFISKPIESQFDFDLDLARKKNSDNPVFYIQYAYARIHSILEKENNYVILDSYKNLTNQKEIEIIKHLDYFKNLVIDVANTKEVNKLCNYAYKLAQLFHSYYNETKILDYSNLDLLKERISLIISIKIVLKNVLNLMGIEAKERM